MKLTDKASLSVCTPTTRIYKIDVEALMNLSHVYHPDDLNNILLFHDCILDMALAMEIVVWGWGERIVPAHKRAHEELLTVWIQL